MKWILIILMRFFCILFIPLQANASSLFFNITAAGTPATVNFNLCLNGTGILSCQNYNVSASDLTILTTISNHVYPAAGIKINTPGYVVSGCTPINNGYCLFSVSDKIPGYLSLGSNTYGLVTVGNPGNDDDITGFGGVSYVFQIGKYEVTIQQYTEFLNAVAKDDTYSLYDTNMSSDLNSAGITRSGSPGSYSYTVMNNSGSSANRPITYVTWFDAARFANWMANGKPSGAENSATTENGAYNLNSAMSGTAIDKNSINPNTGKTPSYYIPTEDEWYKAAYYSPLLQGGLGGYYYYATQSNIQPGNSIGSTPNQANYFTTVFSVTQSPDYFFGTQNYLTSVGAFTNSSSYYGTFDQSGNVWEWNDLDRSLVPYRGLRGGYWFSGSVPLQTNLYSTDALTRADNGIGFRLASPAN